MRVDTGTVWLHLGHYVSYTLFADRWRAETVLGVARVFRCC